MRFKCSNCQRRGLTLVEQENGEFVCVCGHSEPFNFWRPRFENVADILTLREASRVIGAAPNGSTLRRAILAGKLQTQRSGYKHLVARDDLIEFYCYKFHKRTNGH